jgi:hypothetical protein
MTSGGSEKMWNQEYVKLIEFFNTGMEFMSWYGFVQDYIQAFQIKRAFGISNEGHQAYDPLESNSKDGSKLTITNNYIELN